MPGAKGNSLQINAKTFQGGIKNFGSKANMLEGAGHFSEGVFDCQRKREDYQQVVKWIHTSGESELPLEPRTSSPG